MRYKIFLILFILGIPFIPIFPSKLFFYLDNWQFVIFSLIPFGYVLLSVFSPKVNLYFNKYDWIFISFAVFNFLSGLWATDVSLVWVPSFTWLSLLAWLIVVRSACIDFKIETEISYLFVAMFTIMALYLSIAFFTPQSMVKAWLLLRNHMSCFLICLYPYVFNLLIPRKNQIGNSLSLGVLSFIVVSTLVLLLLIFKITSAGVLIALILTFYLLLWRFESSKLIKQLRFVMTGLVSGLVVLIVFFPTNLEFFEVFNEMQISENSDRMMMIRNSLWLFFDHPLIGVGVGNWLVEVYQTDVSDFVEINNALDFVRHNSHDFYSHLIAESGLLGLIPFVSYLVLILLGAWKRLTIDNIKAFSSFSSVIIFLIISFFYATLIIRPAHFSTPLLIAFIGLGILTAQENCKKINKIVLLLFSISLGLAVAYFGMSKIRTESCFRMQSSPNKVDAKEILTSAYSYALFTSWNTKNLIPYHLAQIYLKEKNFVEANKYFKEAIKLRPYDIPLLLSFASAKYEEGDFNTGISLGRKAYELQPNFIKTNLFLGRVYSDFSDSHSAEIHIKVVRDKYNNLIERQRHILNEKNERKRKKNINSFKRHEKIMLEMRDFLDEIKLLELDKDK